MSQLVTMTFEEASRWIASQEKRIDELEAVVRDAECLLTIVEPRSHKAEYLALLKKARDVLGMTAPETKGEANGN